MSQLNHLNVTGSGISDLSPLANARLESLDVSHTNLCDLTTASEHLLSIGRVHLTVGGPEFESFQGLRKLDQRFLVLSLVDAANVDFAEVYNFERSNQEIMVRVVTELSRLNVYRCDLDGFDAASLPMSLRAFAAIGCNLPLLQFSRMQYRLNQVELTDNKLQRISGVDALQSLQLMIFHGNEAPASTLRQLKKISNGNFELRLNIDLD